PASYMELIEKAANKTAINITGIKNIDKIKKIVVEHSIAKSEQIPKEFRILFNEHFPFTSATSGGTTQGSINYQTYPNDQNGITTEVIDKTSFVGSTSTIDEINR